MRGLRDSVRHHRRDNAQPPFCPWMGVAAVFIMMLLASPALAQHFTINRFHSEITVLRDSSLDVRETIQLTFDRPRNGIYREIPLQASERQGTITKARADLQASCDLGRAEKATWQGIKGAGRKAGDCSEAGLPWKRHIS